MNSIFGSFLTTFWVSEGSEVSEITETVRFPKPETKTDRDRKFRNFAKITGVRKSYRNAVPYPKYKTRRNFFDREEFLKWCIANGFWSIFFRALKLCMKYFDVKCSFKKIWLNARNTQWKKIRLSYKVMLSFGRPHRLVEIS